jgi:acyl carrier protein
MHDTARSRFAEQMLEFINRTLPQLDRRERQWPRVHADTPLFADGLLDSLSILHLISRIEELTGTSVPDHLVVMRNFHSVDAMTATFAQP